MDSPTVFITGGSSGIGAAAAKMLAGKGFRVCIMARREGKLAAVAAEIREQCGEQSVLSFVGDVTDSDDRQAALDFALDKWQGRLDVFINNAGYAMPGTVEDADLLAVRDQFDVNTFAPLAFMQLVGPVMRHQGYGRIINVSSISGRMAVPGLGMYAASKFALEALSDAARREYHPWGIKVLLIEPQMIATEIWQVSGDELAKMKKEWSHSPFRKFYDRQIAELAKLSGGGGPKAELVAKSILHAATARRPKSRYLIPWHACFRNFVATLPARLEDAIVRLFVKVDVDKD